MNQSFDAFGMPELPYLLLANPNKEILYSLALAYDVKIKRKFNTLSELEFMFPESIDGGETKLEAYRYLKDKRLVQVEGLGWFQITQITEDDEGSIASKHVLCVGLENELVGKRLVGYSGTKKLYDPISPSGTILKELSDKCNGLWTAGTISGELLGKFRTFNVSDSNIYAFLMNEVSKAFECVFEFNTTTKQINAYSINDATTTSDIFLSFDNLISKSNFQEKSDELVTCLNVSGGNGLTIAGVNPFGTRIYDFTYFKTTEWMTQELIDSINGWEAIIALRQADYSNYLLTIKGYKAELITLKGDLDILLAEYTALETVQKVRIEGGLSYADITAQMTAKMAQINAKEVEMANKQIQIDAVEANLLAIANEVSFDSNFSASELQYLNSFIYESSYHNDNVIQTDSMTDVQIQDQQEILYEQAKKVLAKVSRPRYELKVESVNFIDLPEYEVFTNAMELGTIVTCEVKPNEFIEAVLLEVDYSLDDPNSFTLILSNRLRLDGEDFTYTDLMGEVQNNSSTLTFNSAAWSNWSEEHKDEVSNFMSGALNATHNEIINSENQEIVINTNGLRGRTYDPDTETYGDTQVWLTSNTLAFTDDAWESAKLALGRIALPEGGYAFGLVADIIVGHLLAGNQLTISNENNNFRLDSTGAFLNNASFTLENSVSRIRLDPENGISLQKKTGASAVIGFGAATAVVASNASGVSFNYTVPNQSERLLLVKIGVGRLSDPSVTSVKFGSYNLTRLPISGTSFGQICSEFWYLKNPPIGTATIVIVTPSGSYIQAGATTYWNVDQTTTFGTGVTTHGNTPTASVTVASASNQLVVDCLTYYHQVSNFTPLAGQVQEFHITSDGGWKTATSRESGATSVVMSWNGVSTVWHLTAVGLIKSSTPATYTDSLYFDVNGNATFAGQLSAASGSFSGAITATSGSIGALTIDINGLSDAFGNYIRSNSFKFGALTINGSTATFDGTIYADKLSGLIVDDQVAEGLSASKITVGSMSADRIFGGTITGITINGSVINWNGVSMYSPFAGASIIDASGSIDLTAGAGDETFLSLQSDGYAGLHADNGIAFTTFNSNGYFDVSGVEVYSNRTGDGGYSYSDKIAISTPSGTRYLWFDNGILTNFTVS